MVPDQSLVSEYANQFSLPEDMLMKQIKVESSWDEYAFRYEADYFERYIRKNVHAKGFAFGPLAACSYGLLQIMLETAIEVGFNGQPYELFDSRTGLYWGCRKMRSIYDKFPDSYNQVLAIYNGGEGGNVEQPYRDQAYINRVLAA